MLFVGGKPGKEPAQFIGSVAALGVAEHGALAQRILAAGVGENGYQLVALVGGK